MVVLDTPVTIKDPVIDALEAAAGVIQQGWCQNEGWDPATGGRCLLNAVHEGARNILIENAIHRSLVKRLNLPGQRHNCEDVLMMEWNDTRGRTKDEVLAVLYEEISERKAAQFQR